MRIGRYEVVGEIARGGFGAVLRARDAALGRDVAIKVLHGAGRLGELQRKRFEREVNALARLRHPNIVSVHEAGTCAQGPYVVMDLIEGESLERRLDRDGPLPVREALRLVEVVAGAIAHAHEQGIVHRDLKPANILVDRLANPFVTDFGLARDVDLRFSAEALSRTGASIGTPGFWPPEQAFGALEKMGPRCDVYSLGATLYALLTGQAPYEGDSIIEILGLMAHAPRPASTLRRDLPAAVDHVLARALAHDPADRHGSVAELGAALTEIRRRTAAVTASRGAHPSLRRGVRGRGARGALLAAAGLALVTTIAATLVGRGAAGGDDAAMSPPAVTTSTPRARTEPPSPAPIGVTEASRPASGVAEDDEAYVADVIARVEAALAADRLEEAASALVPAYETRRSDRRLILLHARICLENSQPQVAAQSATFLLEERPDDLAARLIRGKARRRLNEPADVLVDAGHILELEPESTGGLALRAWARSKLGDIAGAFEDWTRAIELEPTAELLVDAGNLAFEQDLLDIAFDDFTHALRLDPDHLLALLNRAAVFTKRGQVELARLDLERAVELRPDHAIPWARRGDHRRVNGDLPGAIADLTRAIELNRDLVEPYRLRGSARLAVQDWKGAVEDFTRAVEREPGRAENHCMLANAMCRSGDLDRALKHADDAVAVDPKYARAYAQRALVHDDRDQVEQALADYDRAIELAPGHVEAQFNRALLLSRIKDPTRARAGLDRVLELEPDHAQALLTRGDLRRRTDDVDGAVADTTRAVELEPDLPEAQLAAALALHTKGGAENLRRAESLYGKFLGSAPTNGRIIVERARCREALGDRAGAKADYRLTVELVPDGPDQVRSFAQGRLDALDRAERERPRSPEAPAPPR